MTTRSVPCRRQSCPTAPRSTWAVIAAAILLAACSPGRGRPDAVTAAAITDTLTRMVREAYDLSRPDPVRRLTSLYPDTGRVVSAAVGRVTVTRPALDSQVARFWDRVGQHMQSPRFVLGGVNASVLSRDAAVLTMTYTIPHRTPEGAPHTIGGAWTALFERRGDRWVVTQEHLSDLPAPP